MEAVLTAFFGFLGVVITGGVIVIAREQLKAAREDVEWWRSKAFGVLEKLVDTQERQVRGDDARDAMIGNIAETVKRREPAKTSEVEHE